VFSFIGPRLSLKKGGARATAIMTAPCRRDGQGRVAILADAEGWGLCRFWITKSRRTQREHDKKGYRELVRKVVLGRRFEALEERAGTPPVRNREL